MTLITTIGLDTAKHLFQLHGINDEGTLVLRRQLRRSELLAFFKKILSCVVGLEACGGAHHWARDLSAVLSDMKFG